jgi:hypothetical protein
MDDEVWDASTFSKNRERLLEGDLNEAALRRTHSRVAEPTAEVI